MEHIPVLLNETLEGLALFPGARCVDGTLGGAGHAEALLRAVGPTGALLGLDLDPAAVERAQRRLAPYGARTVLLQASFGQMAEIARQHDFDPAHAIVLDLGLSTYQLDDTGRGFSFLGEGPLDMRMDPDGALTADDIVNGWREADLADVIYRYGEEPRSRRIARAIVNARPVATTADLADIVARALGGRSAHQRIHPATRTFQAIRIAVNGELETLEGTLPQMVEILEPGGRFAVITFHSLEDRIVKHFIRRESTDCLCPPNFPVCRCGHHATLRPVSGKPITPGPVELENNARSRSAKLRIAERLAV